MQLLSKHLGIAALTLALTAPAYAQGNIDSAYTQINLDECLVLNADDFGASWSCPGYKGFPLYVAEGDLRFFVSFGFGAPDERAASQTLGPFNTIHTTLEWRLNNETGDFKPFATILRYFLEDIGNGIDDEVLVITKIEPGNTCHIAYVDAKTTPNANVVARRYADNEAPSFNCETDRPFNQPEY